MPYLTLLRGLPWKLIGLGAIILFAVVQTLRLDSAKHKIELQRVQLVEEVRKHRQTKANIEAAMKRAEELHQAEVERIEAEQKEITRNVEADYARRRAALDEWVRQELKRRTDQGDTGSAPQAEFPTPPKDLMERRCNLRPKNMCEPSK